MEPLNKKIWVVDDDISLSQIYSGKFREEGFEVESFADGQEAWDAFHLGNAPDLLFTGILMPRMTGFQLIEKFQKDQKLKDVPVVIFSHRGRAEDRILAKKFAVDDFVIQGVVPLIEIVRKIKLVLGIRETYKIVLDQSKLDGEALLDFLVKHQQLNFRAEDRRKQFYLVFKPELESGKFSVQLEMEK